MAEKEFTYDRIDMDRPSFRLIRLLGGSTTYIHCELFEAYLDEANVDGIPYEALSYTWGDIEKSATIKINGMKARVTENLFMALHYLRPVNSDRILWIDAVCIDQGHDKEKGHQVQQMGDIYHMAERVIVWLGTGNQDSDALMDFLKTLPLKTEVHLASQLIPRDLQARYRESMEKLLNRPWFRRIWVIQEVAKARSAIVTCGWKSVSTRALTHAPALLGLEPDLPAKAILEVMPGHLRALNWYSQQPTLYTLLQNFYRSEATDKRDMIYALLGMSSSVHERSKLQADYGKDLRVLIRDTVSTILFPGRTDSLDLFYIDWDWSDFIYNLEDLYSAAFLCALKTPKSEPEMFINFSWDGPKRDDFAVKCKDSRGPTALSIAARYGHEGIVKALLDQDGIDINTKDKDGVMPLWTAARWGHEGIVKLLVEQGGININTKDDVNEATPLWTAASWGHEGIVKLLVKQDGIDMNTKDMNNTTPLWAAAQLGHEGVVKVLLEQDSIEINTRDKDGVTPLGIATHGGHEDVVEVLLEQYGIDIDTKDNLGRTPLRIAVQQHNNNIVKLLTEQGGIEIPSATRSQ